MASRLPRLRRLLVLGGASLLVALVGGSSVAAQPTAAHAAGPKDRVTFGIGPGGQAYVDHRSFLTYSAPPGGQLLDRVAIFNQSDQRLDMLVYPSDALNTQTGALDLRPRAERNTEMGAWITLGQDSRTGRVVPSARSLVRVSVPPQSRAKGIGKVIVPIRVIVPQDASPGDHVAGIVVGLISKGSNPQSQNIELEQRVALRVYTRVSGDVRAGLSVKIVKQDYVGASGLGLHGPLRVTYRVHNTGNIRLGATTALSTKGPFGIGRRTAAGPKVAELVPGGSAQLTAVVEDVWPTVLGWTTATATAIAPPNGSLPTLKAVSDTTRFWAFTWQEVLAVLLLLAWVLYRRWRRAHLKEPRHAKPGLSKRELVGAGALVVALAMSLGVMSAGRAHAATLGQIAVSPTVGGDETLFTGAIENAHCPEGTGDAFFTVDGPDLPPNSAAIGFGKDNGVGYQFFRNASIANIRATNTGAFTHSGAFTIRFNCVRASDGKVVGSYTRVMEYVAAGQGSWRLRGYARSGPTRPPLPGDPYAIDPYASVKTATPRPSATAAPQASRGASPSPTGQAASPSATAVRPPLGEVAGAERDVAEGASDTLPAGIWAAVLGGLLLGVIALAEWRRRRPA